MASFTRKVDTNASLGILGDVVTASDINDIFDNLERLTTAVIDAREFGAVGDGVTDDTAALQTWITHLTTNAQTGFLPAGNYLISDKLSVPRKPNWGIVGAGNNCVTITQATDNTPIFYLGSDTASFMHTWQITGIAFTYTNSQPSTNTAACPITFHAMGYQFVLRDLTFNRGCYGIYVDAAVEAPWGGTWDQLQFGSGLTKGAIDIATMGISGTPNNHWGRFLVTCTNMVGPAIKAQGYNWTIDTIEFLDANGARLLELEAGSQVVIGSLKLELGTFAAGQDIFRFLHNSIVDIGTVTVGGTTLAVTSSAIVNVINSGGGGNGGRTTVEYVQIDATAISGALYAFAGSRSAGIEVGYVSLSGGAQLQNNTSATTAETLTVKRNVNGQLSANKGDASYTVALGDPNIISLQTAFTAQRTVTLPSDGPNMHNGLYYEIVASGAVNGANTLLIKAAAVTLHTETNDKRVIRFTWRRHTTASSGWVMTRYSTLP